MRRRLHPVIISIVDVKDHLNKGVTRCIGDPGYRTELGSIQEKYSLNKSEVSLLFKDIRLQGLRVKSLKQPAFVIQEDQEVGGTVAEDIPVGPGTDATPMDVSHEPALVSGIDPAF